MDAARAGTCRGRVVDAPPLGAAAAVDAAPGAGVMYWKDGRWYRTLIACKRWSLHQARALLGGRQTAAVPSSDAEPLVIDLGCGKVGLS